MCFWVRKMKLNDFVWVSYFQHTGCSSFCLELRPGMWIVKTFERQATPTSCQRTSWRPSFASVLLGLKGVNSLLTLRVVFVGKSWTSVCEVSGCRMKSWKCETNCETLRVFHKLRTTLCGRNVIHPQRGCNVIYTSNSTLTNRFMIHRA